MCVTPYVPYELDALLPSNLIEEISADLENPRANT